jgi:hypothetical protein
MGNRSYIFSGEKDFRSKVPTKDEKGKAGQRLPGMLRQDQGVALQVGDNGLVPNGAILGQPGNR